MVHVLAIALDNSFRFHPNIDIFHIVAQREKKEKHVVSARSKHIDDALLMSFHILCYFFFFFFFFFFVCVCVFVCFCFCFCADIR